MSKLVEGINSKQNLFLCRVFPRSHHTDSAVHYKVERGNSFKKSFDANKTIHALFIFLLQKS